MAVAAAVLTPHTLDFVMSLPRVVEQRAVLEALFELVRRRHDMLIVAAMAAAEFATTADKEDGRRMFKALEAAGLAPTV